MTLLRSLMIGVLAVAAARPVCALLVHPRARVRRSAWALLLAPYLTPALLTGYTYASFSLSLVHHPAFNTIFYSALLWWKFTPVAAVILHFTPAPISPEAIHCHRLTAFYRPAGYAASTLSHWVFLLRAGCGRGPIAAFAVIFLCAFGEFEMASLMGVKSWTVTLFDAHAGGMALGESIRRILGPLLCEAAAVATALVVLRGHRGSQARPVEPGRTIQWLGGCHLVVALLFVMLIPAVVLLWGTVHGIGLLLENFVLGREIVSSLLYAAAATLVAGFAVLLLTARNHKLGSVLSKALLLGAVFSGLLGPLVLSLAILAAVQLPGLIALRETPVPLVLALGLVLLPIALVLKRVLELTGHRSALHLAKLMPKSGAARELVWTLSTSGKFWSAALLFVWVYWDLTASAILAPIGMTPVTVRLYNLMHYGQVAALSAMTCAAFAAPILVFMIALGTRRWWAPR